VLAEWRVLFAFVAFTLIVAAWRPRELRIRREDILWFAAFGVFGMGAVQWLYYEAIQRIPIAVALVVEFTAVILVLVYARLRGRKVGRALWYAGILSLAGCFFASGAYDAGLRAVNTDGVLIAALDAILFTSYFVLGERLASRYSAWTMAVYGFGFALLAWQVLQPAWISSSRSSRSRWASSLCVCSRARAFPSSRPPSPSSRPSSRGPCSDNRCRSRRSSVEHLCSAGS